MKELILILSTLLVACGSEELNTQANDREDRFVEAVIDASRELIADDIYDDLVSLKYGASPLVEWNIVGSDTLLLVATLQSVDWWFDVEVGESVTTDPSPDNMLWVTIPNESKEQLRSEKAKVDSLELNNRLLELIGLRPDGAESTINLLWVNKNSLLRPSYNPGVNTTYGSITYPAEDALPKWYRGWFESNVAYSYASPEEGLNYPFTRLGYTYDWGASASKYGLSEFVIIPSSVVTLEHREGCWSYYKDLR